jgi:hypothetical protein
MSKFKIVGLMVLIAFATGIDSGWRCGGRGERKGGNLAGVSYDNQAYTQGTCPRLTTNGSTMQGRLQHERVFRVHY